MVITGASAGIGFEVARAYAERGAALVLNARDADKLVEARDTLLASDPARAERIELVAGDITDESVQSALIERAQARFGRLDVLVNNAGRGYYARFADIAAPELRALFELNVVAPLALTQRALPALAESRGTVVMVSSVAGIAAAPAMGAYAASKFALEALSGSLRAELAAQHVAVVVVRPGPVATGFREHAASSSAADALQTPTGDDDRQSPRDVARQLVRAVARRQAVVETSLYVRGASVLARTMPRVLRFVTKRMARR